MGLDHALKPVVAFLEERVAFLIGCWLPYGALGDLKYAKRKTILGGGILGKVAGVRNSLSVPYSTKQTGVAVHSLHLEWSVPALL